MVEQAGSVAGFAAIIGLAVLSALYFSQARDLRRLREWAGRAPERAAEGQPGAVVPGRVVAVPQQRPGQPPAPATTAGAGPAPAPTNGAPGADGDKAEGEEKAAQPAASNGDAAPSVAAEGESKDGEGGEAKPEGAPAKPGMPAPASAAAAAAGAGAKSLAGPSAPGAAPSGAPGSTPAAAPGAGPSATPGATPAGAPGSTPGPGSTPSGQPGSAPGAPGSTPPGKPAGSPAAGAGAAAAGAAAAGAAASGAGAATPGTRPGAQPQRTPGSVLPPRTGTLPPVRRLPSSNVGAGAGVGSTEPPAKKRSRLYVVLGVVGVLVLGAAAAVGVPAIVNGTKDSNKSSTASSKSKSATSTAKKAAPVAPDKITVAVLNGTTIPGLAAQVGDRVDAEGFTLGTVSNAPQSNGQRANSVAMYAAGHRRDAAQVARKLSIRNVEPIDSNSQSIAGDASVVVIVGSDKTQ